MILARRFWTSEAVYTHDQEEEGAVEWFDLRDLGISEQDIAAMSNSDARIVVGLWAKEREAKELLDFALQHVKAKIRAA